MKRSALRSTHAATFALALALSGCAAHTTVVSKRGEGANLSPKRVFVQSHLLDARAGANFGPTFANAFDASLVKILGKCGTQVTVSDLTGIEVDSDATLKAIEAFAPDTVVVLTKAHGTVAQYGGLVRATYAFDLYQPTGPGEPVAKLLARGASLKAKWRSTIDFAPGYSMPGSVELDGKLFATAVTNRLKEDGFFPGCAKVVQSTTGE